MGEVTVNRARKALPYILAFLIVLMIFSSYSNTFTSPPYLDDFHSFIQEKALYLHSVSASSLLALHKIEFGWVRFLPVVTLALNLSLGHGSVIYFHAVNLLIHLLAFFAVFWLVRQVLAAGKSGGAEAPLYEMAGLFPLCVAAIWALSPVQTSAVTYLVQRMASMQALFFTLSTACFIKARLLSGEKTRGAAVFYLLCALAALCSFLSKENSAVLPIALALADIWFFDSAWLKKAWKMCLKTGWKVRIAAIAVLISCSFYAFAAVLPKLLSGYTYRDFSLMERLLTEGRVVVWYMSLLLWPVPSRLSMEHDVQISTSLISPLTTFPALILIAALIFFAVRHRKRFPVITFGIAWFFLNLIIESTIIPLELVFEHRLYLPSMGFYLSVAALLAILFRLAARRLAEAEFAKAACSMLLIGAACLALLTFIRNDVWDNSVTIHYDAVTKAPDSPRANANFANTLCEAGRYDEAVKYADKAIELGRKGREAGALALNALNFASQKLGKTDEAIKRSEEFVNTMADWVDSGSVPDLCLNIARNYSNENKPEDAYRWSLKALDYVQRTNNSYYKKTLVETNLLAIVSKFGIEGSDLAGERTQEPQDLPPAVWVAREFKKHGEEQYAHEIIEREYAKDPGEPNIKEAFENLKKEDALNLAQKGKFNFFQKYLQSPFSRFNFDMAVAYLVQEKQLPRFFQDLGERRLDAALEISPDSRDALLLKGWCLYNRDDADHAVGAVRKVLDGDPENSNAWLALGFFLARAGDADGAVAAFEKVIDLYPGYPKRVIVEELCRQLTQGKSIESASNR
ncbi:MAG: tetratricopeptide repeat protein [Syntrophobacteraceae bacterium]